MKKKTRINGGINEYYTLNRNEVAKRVRLKTVLFLVAIVLIIFVVICGGFSILLNIEVNAKIDEQLVAVVLGTDKILNRPTSPSTDIFDYVYYYFDGADKEGRLYFSQSFTIEIASDGTVSATFYPIFFTEEEIRDIYAEIDTSKQKGKVGNYRYLVMNHGGKTKIGVLDTTLDKQNLTEMIAMVWGVAGVFFAVISLCVVFISKLIVKPVSEMVDNQNKFVSDASHELKTPLSIISANADILKDEMGENKWLDNISGQVDRMSELINEMLQISKIEEVQESLKTVDLSYIVLNSVLPFEAVAFEKEKIFRYNIDDNCEIECSEKNITQAITILVDNAIKYSKPNGEIIVTLSKLDSRIYFETYNTGSDVGEEEKYLIFKRFYRADSSRVHNETGGNGLGLSIVQSFAQHYKWDIEVDCKMNEFMRIRVYFNK